MNEAVIDILQAGEHKNTLGRAHEVLHIVLHDKGRLEELYEAISHDDAWVRMRAIDVFEKVCRAHPDWIEPYIDRIQRDLSVSTQPSIQWHVAQIYMQVSMNNTQKEQAIIWLKKVLSSGEVDWIVAVNAMKALANFVQHGDADDADLRKAAEIQLRHASSAVRRHAEKYLV